MSDYRQIEKLYVFKKGEYVGVLQRESQGVSFVYDAGGGTRTQIATTLPVRKEPYVLKGDSLHPFFAGLLPEGLRLTALIKAVKTSPDDLFTLLAASGHDLIGDVSVSESREHKAIQALDEEGVDFEKVNFEHLFQESITTDSYEMRKRDPSIAGVQNKISAQMISFPVAITGKKKRYILKLSSKDFPKIVENEHFFMCLAKRCGVTSVDTKIVYDSEKKSALLVERFDRVYDNELHQVRALSQEDACQFLGRYPQDKYRLSVKEIAHGIAEYCSYPVIQVAELLRLVLFSYLIANGDLHAKNISILEHPDLALHILAPGYDLLSTLPYGDDRMALRIAGRDKNIRLKDFIDFGESFGVREKALRSLFALVTAEVAASVDDIDQIGLPDKKTVHLKKVIKERVKAFDIR